MHAYPPDYKGMRAGLGPRCWAERAYNLLRQTAEEAEEPSCGCRFDWRTQPETVLKICDSHNGLLVAARAEGERAGDANVAAVVEALECDAHPVPEHTAVAEIVADIHAALHRAERQISAIRALWPHIEVAAGPRSYDKSKVYDPGSPTCLRCKIEEALNAAR